MSAYAVPKIEYGGFVPTVISFDFPASSGQAQPDLEAVKKESESLSGLRQTSLFYIEETRKLKFKFVSETIHAQLATFFKSWAAKGKSFRYYPDKTLGTYENVQWDSSKMQPKVIAPVGLDTYIYEVDIPVRRVADDANAGGYVEHEILNNQSVAVDIEELLLDSDSYKSVRIFFEIFRKTDSSERVANGDFTCLYKASTDTWALEPGDYRAAESHGVVFSITAAGQIQYTSDNMSGTNYEGTALFRNFSIIEG